jgi:hypothetical protein
VRRFFEIGSYAQKKVVASVSSMTPLEADDNSQYITDEGIVCQAQKGLKLFTNKRSRKYETIVVS